MAYFRYLAIYSILFSIIFVTPYLTLTGFDTIGFDSGGDGELIVSSDPYGIIPTIELDVSPPPDLTPGGGSSVSRGFSVEPLNFNLNLLVNTNIEKFIKVTNLDSQKSLPVSQEGLDGLIILESDSLSLGTFESKNFSVIFVAPSQSGTFIGKIKIGDVEILISMNVKEKLLLFDSNIVVLNRDYIVKQGSELKTEVTLIPMGDKDRLDVTLNYVIKDFGGKTFLTKSETLLIEDRKTFKLNFDTGLLPIGDYVIGLELVYPNGVATSTASFKVVEKISFGFGALLYYLIMAALICGILIIGLLLQDVTREKENNFNTYPMH